jgi:hypothetical protein
VLLATLELLDGPLSLVLLHFVLGNLSLDALRNFKGARGSVLGELELCNNLGGCLVVGTCCLNFKGKLKFIWA